MPKCQYCGSDEFVDLVWSHPTDDRKDVFYCADCLLRFKVEIG